MMSDKAPRRTDSPDLRRRAEELLRGKPADLAAIPPEESRRLLHELRVHQIELEMQNDELRKAQLELEALHLKYFDLYDLAPVGYCTVNGEGSILDANLAAAAMLGVERARLVNQLLSRWIAPDHQDIYYLRRKSLLETGTHQVAELRMLRRDGSPFWARMELDAGRKGEAGENIGRVVMVDISDSKRAEEEKNAMAFRLHQARRLESLGVLAGGIAHDFNNLLTVIQGNAEMVLREIPPASTARRNTNDILAACNRAADLCRQMLLCAGKSLFLPKPVDLPNLVGEMATLLKSGISNKATLDLKLERGLPLIEADPIQIRQIVTDLILNASEAIGDRSGNITVSVGVTQCDKDDLGRTELHGALPPGLYVYLEVTDTGKGMDAKTQSRIFDPFFSTKFPGRGLGLPAILGIVRAHKGALKVFNEPGKGVTFKILFPALEVEETKHGKVGDTDGSDRFTPSRLSGAVS